MWVANDIISGHRPSLWLLENGVYVGLGRSFRRCLRHTYNRQIQGTCKAVIFAGLKFRVFPGGDHFAGLNFRCLGLRAKSRGYFHVSDRRPPCF